MKTKWITPDELYIGMKNQFTHKRKVTFFSAFLYGILVYFGAYSKGLTNPDGLWNSVLKISGEWEVSLGRFMLPIVDIIRGDVIANVLYSVIAIGIISLAIMWLAEFVKCESDFWNIVFSVLLMSNQLIGTIITYYYCSIAYAIGLAASVFAVRILFVEQEKNTGKWHVNALIKGIICVGVSLGCYQSYIGVVAFLMIWMLLLLNFRKEITWKKFGTEILQTAVLFAGGVAGYWIVMKASLKYMGITLADYKNAGSVGLLESIKAFPESLSATYRDFFSYYFSNILQVNGRLVMLAYLCLFLLASLIVLVWWIIQYKAKVKKGEFIIRSICGIVMMGVIPPAANMVRIAVPGNSMILLMTSGLWVVLPVALLAMVMQLKTWKMPLQSLAKWVVFLVVLVLIRNNIQVESSTQLALEEIRNKTYTMSVRILEQIEQTPGYEKGMKICINGSTDDFSLAEDFSRGSWIVKEGAFWEDYEGTYKPWQKFFAHELGVEVEFVTEEEYERIIQTEEFQHLNIFPKEGCTTVLDNVAVMKLVP